MNIEHAKAIPISVILDKLNRKPVRIKGHTHVYFSVFREEKTASLFVDTKGNRWRDFGDFNWQGGDGIHLVRAYLDSQDLSCDVSSALRWLSNMTGFVPSIQPVEDPDEKTADKTIILRRTDPIGKEYLLEYGRSRGIPDNVLKACFKQAALHNKNTGKIFHTLCMKNDWKGYELRNKAYKGCIGRKYITFIRGTDLSHEAINVFEGAFDFATVITQNEGKPLKHDSIILHSLSNLKKATAYIKNYEYRYCQTWMDNDEPGKQAVLAWEEFCKAEQNLIHVPMNEFYLPYKDVNAAHIQKFGLGSE